jgi:signal transduction histidine kinase
VKRLLRRRNPRRDGEPAAVAIDAARGRALIEASREVVVVVDDSGRVVTASRRAREAIAGLAEGKPLPESARSGRAPLEIPYDVLGRGETLVYLSEPAENAAYEELRAGFTAAVSHELRTPLARLLVLLETALLPAADAAALVEQARGEVLQIRELIDDVLFLSELESGRQVVSLGAAPLRETARAVADALSSAAIRADVAIEVEEGDEIHVALRPRMLRVVLENLIGNAIRYAGARSRCTVSARQRGDEVELVVADDGGGVDAADLPRLFERFYRSDRSRASRGSGLGLAIVKHVVTAAGGTVEAGTRRSGGLEIRCRFPVTEPSPF